MTVDVGILDQVTQQFLTAFKNDAHWIQQTASHLFYYLVVIQLTLTVLWMVLAGESLFQMLGRLVQLAFLFGVFYALIFLGSEWMPALLNGFIQLGQKGGVQSLDPSSIVDQGVSIAGSIFKGFFGWGLLGHPFVSVVGSIICIAILVIYALMAAELAIVLVKAYVVVATSSLFFAFSALEVTREMTKKYFQASIGLGLNLMALYLLLGVGQHIGSEWAAMTARASEQHELMPMLVILAAVIVYYMILKNVPAFIAGLSGVGGFRNYGSEAIGMAIHAGGIGTNAVLTARHLAGRSIQSVAQGMHAGAQVGKGFYQSFHQSGGGFKGFHQGVERAAGDFVRASANTVKDTVMKTNTEFSTGQKLNRHLANRVKGAKGEN